MNRRSAKSFCLSALAAFALAGAARAQTVVTAYQKQLEIQPLATLTANPTQMAWGRTGGYTSRPPTGTF